MPGVVPSEGFNAQLKRVVKQVLREERTPGGNPGRYGERRVRRKHGLLTSALAAATAFDTGAATATATEYIRNTVTGNLEDTGVEYTITNRYQNITVASGIYIQFQFFDGEWHIVGADCG